jgi:hypothetical protein
MTAVIARRAVVVTVADPRGEGPAIAVTRRRAHGAGSARDAVVAEEEVAA